MLEFLEKFADHLERATQLGKDIKVKGKFDKVFVSGMGGSGIPGDILKTYVKNIPVFSNKGYFVPKIVDKRTLAFVISYSGKTEETLCVYKELVSKGVKTVVITSGGKLKTAKNKVMIPVGMPPRAALPYLFFPMLSVLKNLKMIPDPGKEVRETVAALHKFDHLQPKKLAKQLYKKIPVIYSSKQYEPVIERWRTQLNENTKVLALTNTIPELDHNEVTGHTNEDFMQDRFHTIFIQDKAEDRRIVKRIGITSDILRRAKEPVTVLNMPQGSFFTKLFTAVHYGDWVSYYLAMEYKVDPLPVPVQDEIKSRMKRAACKAPKKK